MKKYIHCFKKYIFLKVAGERYKIQKGHIFLKILINILIQCWFEIEDFNKNYIRKLRIITFFVRRYICAKLFFSKAIFNQVHLLFLLTFLKFLFMRHERYEYKIFSGH